MVVGAIMNMRPSRQSFLSFAANGSTTFGSYTRACLDDNPKLLYKRMAGLSFIDRSAPADLESAQPRGATPVL